MPRTNNPWADVAQNLSNAVYGDPAQTADYEHTLSRAKAIQGEARRARERRAALKQASDALKMGDQETAYTHLITAGPDAMKAAPDYQLGYRANFDEDAGEDDIRRSFVGAGNKASDGFAATTGRADDVSARDAREDRKLERAKPQSVGEAIGQLVRTGEMEPETGARLDNGDYGGADSGPGRPDSRAELVPWLVGEKGYTEDQALREVYGTGNDGDDGTDPLDHKRMNELQDAYGSEMVNMLADAGVPSDDDGNIRTDLLPSGYFQNVQTTAWELGQEDDHSKPPGHYIDKAMEQHGRPKDYTKDNDWWWGRGEEELTMSEGSGRASDALGGGESSGGSGQADKSAGQADSSSGAPLLMMPDGRKVTRQDIRDTAENNDMTEGEVMEWLQKQGARAPDS